MLEALGLFVDLVPAVAEHLHEEHLEKPVVANQLEGDLPTLFGQLLAPIAVVLDQALGDETAHHLAHRRRGDAEALGELARGDGSGVAVEVVEGFEVVLLRLGERAAPGDFDHRCRPRPT